MWHDIEKPWKIAFEQGWESLKKGSIPIGAVIINEHGDIISKGRNRLFEKNTKNPKIAHAETEALLKLDVSNHPNVYEYTLYACMEPCPMCMGTIVMSNLRKLCVAARDSYCGAVHYCQDDPYIIAKKMQINFELGILETVQLTLQTYFELKTRNGAMNHITSIFERDNPIAVRIAKSFYDDGFLENCISKGIAFDEVFNQIVFRSVQA